MWFSAKGKGIHSHSTPGATVTATPAGGVVSWGYAMGAFNRDLFASVAEICLTCRQLVCHHIQFSGLYVRCSIFRLPACRHEPNTNHH
jgi:hypothetical protein